MPVSQAIIDSPIGPLELESDEAALTGIRFHARGLVTRGRLPSVLAETKRQLHAYFDRDRTTFDVPLAPKGTPFQLDCWSALLEIPYGATRTYQAIAERIKRPIAVRAVGAANGANPIPIIIPCHRVIGSNGKLVGFGGGIEMKQRLLELEGARLF